MKTGTRQNSLRQGGWGSVSWGTGEHPSVGVFVPFSKHTLNSASSVSDPVLAGWPWVGLWGGRVQSGKSSKGCGLWLPAWVLR